ncbi:transposase [Viridibacillus sp. YIM B01967]|uniref:Transposase n=1 Tax=Viridibacillus soli TaxID=2798301 RepID=A0ABS1HAC8_9BACL|nr:transposase [Viridibacillus soli]MBK3496387.1 transposase [Viridibacillus soli]
MKQKRYNQEFKQTVVELYRSGTPVNQLSSEYLLQTDSCEHT